MPPVLRNVCPLTTDVSPTGITCTWRVCHDRSRSVPSDNPITNRDPIGTPAESNGNRTVVA